MPASSVIDPQAIENLRALNPGDNDEFLREITGIYLEDTPLRLAELDASLVAGDVMRFTRAAHSIKGSSANVGANQVRATAETLEHRSRTDGLAGLQPLVAQLKADYREAEAEINQLTGRG